MFSIKINKIEFLVNSKLSVLEACSLIGINVPRFCYHEILSVSGNCRMCLVEIEKSPKPVASCVSPLFNGISIFTDTPLVKKARENILETLLLNHPLDCPICDQGGECDLQDQTTVFGSGYSRFFNFKRGVEDKDVGSFIKTIMTRCIHCTRCVRFSDEISGISALGTFNRGNHTEIGSYIKNIFNSEISGNVIDLCPVGALTSKPYAFKVRPWELRCQETVDCTDSSGSNIQVHLKDNTIVRVQSKINNFTSLITDKTRFSYDSTIINRLKKCFSKDEKGSFNIVSYNEIINNIIVTLQTKNVGVIISDNTDLETIFLLKMVNKKFYNTKIFSINGNSKFYNNNNNFDINEAKICFIFGSNLKVENSLINLKIRNKFYNSTLKVISSNFFSSTFPICFINLQMLSLLKIVEGKSLISKYLLYTKNPLIVLGSGVRNKINLNNYKNIFLKIFPTGILFENTINNNENGLAYSNIEKISSKKLNLCKTIFAINLEDNILIRKLLKKSNFFWFNTHGSVLAQKALSIIPTLTFFEEERFFLNVNYNIKKTNKIINLSNILPLKILLNKIFFNRSLNLISFNFFSFYLEILNDKNYSSYLTYNFAVNKFLFNLVQKYPLKFNLEDFYCNTTYTKNSSLLLKRTQELKKLYYFF